MNVEGRQAEHILHHVAILLTKGNRLISKNKERTQLLNDAK
jgi:hypothetical protein